MVITSKLKKTKSPKANIILKTLLERGHFMSTTEVAKTSETSWNTAEKHLNYFHEKGWIANTKRGNRSYWKAYRKST